MSGSDKLTEIDSNLERFLELLPSLLSEHRGDYVLMRRRNVEGYFPSALDAQIAGNSRFDDRGFSIQHIQEVAEELGHFSHAISPGTT